jgi:hypothetical protein
MIPKGAEGVGHLAARLVMETMPKAQDAYMAADLGMVAGLLGMVAQDYDRAAEVLVADDTEIRALFEEAAALPLPPEIKDRMATALASRPAGLRISQLSAHMDRTMRILIDLHASVEEAEVAGAAWAGPFDGKIWTFPENHVARHAYDSAF